MKKLLMLLVTAIFLTSIGISGGNIKKDEIRHEIYIPKNSISASLSNAEIVGCGMFDIVKVDGKHYESVKDKIPCQYGEYMKYKGCEGDIHNIINKLNIAIYDRDKIGDKIVLYGYSDKLQGGVPHNGKLVNIQFCFGNNLIEIGTPLIMGSY